LLDVDIVARAEPRDRPMETAEAVDQRRWRSREREERFEPEPIEGQCVLDQTEPAE